MAKDMVSDPLLRVQVVVAEPEGIRVGAASFIGMVVSTMAMQLTIDTSITSRAIYRFISPLALL